MREVIAKKYISELGASFDTPEEALAHDEVELPLLIDRCELDLARIDSGKYIFTDRRARRRYIDKRRQDLKYYRDLLEKARQSRKGYNAHNFNESKQMNRDFTKSESDELEQRFKGEKIL